MKLNKKPLLTVAIPTYKRPETLEKILKQLRKEKNQDFILLISDDSVDTRTENMIKKFIKQMPNLVYSKNKKNLGFSGNVARLYDLAQTRYVWFLCDDDTVLPGAIKKIIEAIRKYQPVVAVFNAEWTDPLGRERTAGVDEDKIYADIQKMKDYDPLMRTTFLSIIVVEKRITLDSLKKKSYTDNIFFQVTLSLLLLSDKFKFYEIASPIVKRNVGYKYGEFFKFYLVDQLKAVTLTEHKFEEKKFIKWSRKHLFSALQLYLSQKIGLFKYHGRPTRQTIRMVIKFYKFYSILIFSFVLLYYLIPSFVIKGIYIIQLCIYHGYKKAKLIYIENVNRAITDSRKTGFTTYR